jgi:hypothetical protein
MKEKAPIENYSKKAVRLANLFFTIGVVVSVILVWHFMFPHISDTKLNLKLLEQFWALYTAFFVISAAFCFLGLKLPDKIKVDLAQALLALIVSLYVIELYLQLNAGRWDSEGKPSQFETLEELRRKGFDAQGDIGGLAFFESNGLEIANGRIFPIGGISNRKVVLGIDIPGYFPVLEMDEHGFINKKGLYVKDNVDIVVLGECNLSSIGQDDPNEENIGEQLRKLGFRAINLAKPGPSLSLMYLATLKEYAEHIRPKVVIVQFGGSIADYKSVNVPMLRKYLKDSDYSQNLISRQDEIDNYLIEYLYENWEKTQGEFKRSKLSHFLGLFKLSKLRISLCLVPCRPPPITSGPPSADFIKNIKKMDQLVSSWGGKLYGMYWPPIARYKDIYNSINNKSPIFPNPLAPMENYGDLEKNLNIGIINMRKEVFDVHPDPQSLYTPYKREHFYLNGEAQRLMAEAVAKRLKADGLSPH